MTKLKRVAIRGSAGRWTAEVEGRHLPVIHQTLLDRLHYCDTDIGEKRHTKDYASLMAAFERERLVVLQKDKASSYSRDGYIAVYEYSNFRRDPNGGFSLDLIARYADPA